MAEPCDEYESLLASAPACYDPAWNARLLKLIGTVIGCGVAPCATPELVVVPNGTLTSQFIDVGWDGVRPNAAEHKVLYVVRGCEVFIGVNNADCELESGFGWCPLCTGRVKQIAQLNRSTISTLPQSLSYVTFPIAATEWIEDFNNGVILAVGGEPRIDNPLLNVPARCFQIDGGLHQMDISIGFLLDFAGNYVDFDVRLFDVTGNTAVRTWKQYMNDRGSSSHAVSVHVNPSAANIYRIDYRANAVGATSFRNSGADSINIERIA